MIDLLMEYLKVRKKLSNKYFLIYTISIFGLNNVSSLITLEPFENWDLFINNFIKKPKKVS